jgi:hypothetical protein
MAIVQVPEILLSRYMFHFTNGRPRRDAHAVMEIS